MSKYFPSNRRWPERDPARDAYGNFLPGNKPDRSVPLHAGGYPYENASPMPAFPPCVRHNEPIRLTDTPVRVTAGSVATPLPLDAVFVDLTGQSRRVPVVTGLPGPRPITVRVTWPDMGVPALSRNDWHVIATRLADLRRPVHIACVGGHGRTGTALAILLAIWGVIPADADAVEWVRANYCNMAIEAEAQAAYARRMGGK